MNAPLMYGAGAGQLNNGKNFTHIASTLEIIMAQNSPKTSQTEQPDNRDRARRLEAHFRLFMAMCYPRINERLIRTPVGEALLQAFFAGATSVFIDLTGDDLTEAMMEDYLYEIRDFARKRVMETMTDTTNH